MDLDRALEHAWDGDALLFAGTGFSKGATNLLGQPFKDTRQLADHLSRASEVKIGVRGKDWGQVLTEDNLPYR